MLHAAANPTQVVVRRAAPFRQCWGAPLAQIKSLSHRKLMIRSIRSLFLAGITAVLFGGVSAQAQETAVPELPAMRWGHMENHAQWNEAAYQALQTHGLMLTLTVPEDIDTWCPGYPEADLSTRRLFWIGFLSALAKHESTYKPRAVGGDGRWFGLVQISPATARGYECRVGTGEALKKGAANLSCAIRIMSVTVPRDGVIHARDSRWRGVSADWGPMRSASKRADMARWLNQQPFCQATPEPAKAKRLKRSRGSSNR
jgi:hypothetical protein